MNRYLFDFKAAVQSYGKNPDVACITGAGHIRFVGELKAPWLPDPALSDDAWFRHVLGEPLLVPSYDRLRRVIYVLIALRAFEHQTRISIHV